MRERGSGTRALFDQVIARHLPGLNIRLELEHTEAIKRAVESGLGVGCLSRLALREAFGAAAWSRSRRRSSTCAATFISPTTGSAHISPATREFLALCREMSACGGRHRRPAAALHRLNDAPPANATVDAKKHHIFKSIRQIRIASPQSGTRSARPARV
jgi:DNA-binding transcriptional LysR family regulator